LSEQAFESGVLLLDKPIGITSNKALQMCKRLFGIKKAGHTGSLDPLATGMLPICFGEATKFSQYLLESDKTYLVRAKLGIKTDTADAMGEVIATAPLPENWQEKVEGCLELFRGEITQVPPMYSALKHQGKALYQLARQGIEVERAPRKLVIHDLVLKELTESEMTLSVSCSKGTYIRTLVEDIGHSLGTHAHVVMLRRERVAHFTKNRMLSFSTLEDLAKQNRESLYQQLLPIEAMLPQFPVLTVDLGEAKSLFFGQVVACEEAISPGLWVLNLPSKQFIGMGEVIESGKISPKRLISTKILEKALCA
jgi:tRNA pseudouridine55 synthase